MAYESTDKKQDSENEGLRKTALSRWKHAIDSDSAQRIQEKEDLSFQVPENQWSEEAKAARKGRPILSISKLDQPTQLILNQERAAKLGVNIHPLSEEANDDTAQIIQGLYRHIERDSRAGVARSWAYQRAVIAGRGFWRVNALYDEDGGNPFDQKIVIEPIYYQHSVVFDPASTKPDRSDANYCFVESWVDEDTYRREWPNAKLPSNETELEQMSQDAPGWTEMQGEKRAYRVVEYWYKVHERETIVMLEDGTVVPANKVPEGAKVMVGPNGQEMRRERAVVRVKFCKLSGCDVLESVDWDGKYIPIIQIIGRELQPFDGKRRCVGIVNHSKDGQRFFNYAASTYVERMAQEPKAPVVGYVGQFEGVEEQWDSLNTKNLSRLEVNPVIDKATNQVLPLPQRMQIDLTGVSLAGQAMQIADGLIQSTTTVFDAGLGRLTEDTRKSSGRALLALQQQADASTSDFMQQLADAMAYEAKVVLDLMPIKYDRPGRVTRILRGDDDKAESVMLNKPYAMVDGKPVPMDQAQGQQAANVKTHDLSRGRYGVSVSIGKSFQSRLEHGAEFMAQILEKMPQFLPLLGDLVFRYRDDPGAKEIADRLAKVREQQYPGLGEGEDGNIPPEQLQAQNQALQQQMQQMQQQMQMAMEQIKTEQAKQQAAIQIAQMREQTTLQKTEMDNATKMAIAERDANTKALMEEMRAFLQQLKGSQDTRGRHEDQAHQFGMQQAEFTHERQMQHEKLAQETAMAAASGRTFNATREGGQDHDTERSDESSHGSSSVPQADGDNE